MKIDLNKLLDEAMHSSWALRKLNFMLSMGIRFNRPHGIRIHKVEKDAVITRIDLRKINTNHIGGIHACGLATAAEFCSGLVLLRSVNPLKYRLIMQKLEVQYHYQAKKDAFARFEMDEKALEEHILSPLNSEDAIFHTCEVPVHDADGKHLCTAYTTWQIKRWDKVRSK